MRKITLVAMAAMVAAGSYAAGPSVFEAGKVVKANTEVIRLNAVKVQNVQSRANDDITFVPDVPLYRNQNGFFLGNSENGYGYSKPFGILPGRGQYTLVPVFGTTGNTWTWSEYGEKENEEPKEYTESADILQFPLYPGVQTDGSFTMKTTFGDTPKEYNDSAVTMLCGGGAEYWGFPKASELETTGEYGVTPVVYSGSKEHLNIMSYALSFDKNDDKMDENGLEASAWTQIFDPAKYSDLKMASFGNVIPAQSAPYQMSKVFFALEGKTTAATPITISVYEYTLGEFEDLDMMNKGKLLGKGTAILPEGDFTPGETGYVIAEVKAVNALGLATNRPVCVSGQSVYVEVSGLDAETIEAVSMIVNGGAYVPTLENGRPNAIWNEAYPKLAYVGFSAKQISDNGDTNVTIANPWWFPAQDNKSGQLGTAYLMWYVLKFPILLNAVDGSTEFSVTVPATGGQEVAGVFGSEDLIQLYEDGIITASSEDDWFTYDVAYDEEQEVFMIGVDAQALPEGVTGRTGAVKFTGYACDFVLSVVQGDGGEENSINEVKNVAAGAAEYFDLQGRKLSAAPAKGLYIERNGSAASTKLAR